MLSVLTTYNLHPPSGLGPAAHLQPLSENRRKGLRLEAPGLGGRILTVPQCPLDQEDADGA